MLAQVGVVAALGSGAVPGLISWRCLRGECCARFRAALAGPFPPEVGYVSLYSRSDGIVDWRSCLDPDADACVEVRGSHCGMSLNPERLPRDRARARRLRRRATAGWAAGGLSRQPRSSSATHSMCGVCGNMSTGRTRRSA